jgi:hypothetical protein
MTMNRAITLLAILFALVTLDQRLMAQRGWQYLGEANVDGQADHDVIRVTGAEGRFRAIRSAGGKCAGPVRSRGYSLRQWRL